MKIRRIFTVFFLAIAFIFFNNVSTVLALPSLPSSFYEPVENDGGILPDASYILTVILAGTGSGTVTSAPNGISCPGTCSFTFSTSVTLTASSLAGSTFTGWSGGDCSGTGTCTVPMTADTTVTATFIRNAYPLTVILAGTGSGTVTSAPAGISCPGTCSLTFSTSVTLTASALAGSTFSGWSGGDCSGTGTCTVPMTADTTITATFTHNTYQLTVILAGTGSGTVTSAPSGISCPSTCKVGFDSSVTLTAVALTGTTFTGWNGGSCSGTGTCTVPMTANTTVRATFTHNTYILAVVLAGTGSGMVTSAPFAINCPSTCSASFSASVTLTAIASTGTTFTGWNGGGCAGTDTCTVPMTANTTVTATFTHNPYLLEVAPAGTGSGMVTSDPDGISCPSTCTVIFSAPVTLTAVASTGSTFTGWSGGGCSGTGNCTVPMTADTTITANFILNTYLLTVVRAGYGSGTVTSSTGGISCGLTCTASFYYNTSVTLNAVAATGSTFLGWSGVTGCPGTGTCTILMTVDPTMVTASFKDTTPPTVSWNAPVSDGQVFHVGNRSIQLEVNANDNIGISKVVFYHWYPFPEGGGMDIEIGTVYAPPYRLNFDTSVLLPNWNQVDAYAYDADNNFSRKYIWLNHLIWQVCLPLILH